MEPSIPNNSVVIPNPRNPIEALLFKDCLVKEVETKRNTGRPPDIMELPDDVLTSLERTFGVNVKPFSREYLQIAGMTFKGSLRYIPKNENQPAQFIGKGTISTSRRLYQYTDLPVIWYDKKIYVLGSPSSNRFLDMTGLTIFSEDIAMAKGNNNGIFFNYYANAVQQMLNMVIFNPSTELKFKCLASGELTKGTELCPFIPLSCDILTGALFFREKLLVTVIVDRINASVTVQNNNSSAYITLSEFWNIFTITKETLQSRVSENLHLPTLFDLKKSDLKRSSVDELTMGESDLLIGDFDLEPINKKAKKNHNIIGEDE